MFDSIEKFFENLGEITPENYRWFGISGLAAGILGGVFAIPAMLLVPETGAWSLSVFGIWASLFGFIVTLIAIPHHLSRWEMIRSSFCGAIGLFIGICIPIFTLAIFRFLILA